jgi:hypothetical protein
MSATHAVACRVACMVLWQIQVSALPDPAMKVDSTSGTAGMCCSCAVYTEATRSICQQYICTASSCSILHVGWSASHAHQTHLKPSMEANHWSVAR